MGAPSLPSPAYEALRRVGQGAGSFVLISGGSRAERSVVLDSVEQLASSSGWETLRLRAHPTDEQVPYGALQPWLARWAHPLASSGHSGPGGDGGPAFTMPLVGLIAGLPAHDTEPSGGAHPAPRRASEADRPVDLRAFSTAELRAELVDLVQGRTQQNAAVVLIEDADFLDAPSRDWFSFLGARMADLPLAVALSVDEEDEPWHDRFAKSPTVWCPLPRSSSGSAEDRLRSRVRALPARSLDALSLAVLAGPDADRATLKDTLGCTDQELNLALSPAIDAELLRFVGDRYEVTEPALFPGLVGILTSPQRNAGHRKLAQTLAKRPGHEQGKLLFRLSDHWAEAGDVGRGVPALISASREAERWGAPELAERRLLRAVLLAQTDPTARGRELEERIYAEMATLRLREGRPEEGLAAYQRALALAKERGTKVLHWARYVAGISDAEVRLGGHPDERLKATLEEVQGRSSDLEALLSRSLSYYYLERARFEEAVTTSEKACELADKGHDTVLKVRCRSSAASAYIFGGAHAERARAHLLRALEHRKELQGTSDEILFVSILDELSLLECSLGREEEALRWGEESLTTARRFGYGTSLLLVLGNLPEHYVHRHDLARAQALAEELRRMVQRFGLPERDNHVQQLYLVEGRIAADTGDYATARERFERLVASTEKGGSKIFLSQALVHLIVLSARQNHLDAAHRYHRRLEREGLGKSIMGENRRLLDEVEPLLKGSG